MPPNFISAALLVCERVLCEHEDGMLSVIRIADAFSFQAHPNLTLEEQQISMQVLLIIKMLPEDHAEHSLKLEMIKPNGEVTLVGTFEGTKSESKQFPGLPGGMNLVANWSLPKRANGVKEIRIRIQSRMRRAAARKTA
jgi:hypothetical protein